jgi:hypothetical protein
VIHAAGANTTSLPWPRKDRMSVQLRIWLAVIGWTVGVTLLHLSLNTRALDFSATAKSGGQFRVGFLPVT